MNRNILILASLVLTCATVVAQKNLKTATLITSNNQAIKGIVDDREWFGNPDAISFKAEGTGTFKKYTASEAVAVKIDNGNQYFSKTVTIDKTNDQRLEVDNYLDSTYTSFKTVTIFLLAELLSDKMNLYSVTDNKLHLFAEKPGSPITELIHRRYRLRRNDRVYDEEDNTYVQQLEMLFVDCPAVAEYQLDTEFSTAAISKQVAKYINCEKGAASYQKKAVKGSFSIGVLAGASVSSLSFVENPGLGGSKVIYDKRLSSKPSVLAGVRFQYTVPGRQQRISLVGDLYYSRYSGEAEKQVAYTSPTFYTNRKLNVEFSILRTDILFRYAVVSSQGLSVFLNTGMSFTKPVNDKSITTDTEVFGSNTTINVNKTFESAGGLRPIIVNITGGAGAAYKQYSLEYRLYKLGRLAKGIIYPVDLLSHQLMFAYKFKQ
jgi:Outer membrane protein beta-barrel domain